MTVMSGKTTVILPRPDRDDADDFYFTYIDQVPEGDVLGVLKHGVAETRRLISSRIHDLPADWESHRYAPGKWSVRAVVGHVLDAERIFGFRAFWFARGAGEPLPGMDQDVFATHAGAEDRPVGDLLDELAVVREGYLRLFRGFDEAAWERTGVASGYPIRVRALPYIMAGHEIHHRRVLAERYLGVAPPTP
jgi:uncharacterized damage-inducible protein DinB